MPSLLLSLIACTASVPQAPPAGAPSEPSATLDVAALSFPAGWLAERIGGSHAHVTVVLPEGEDAVSWQPDANTIASLSSSDLIVMNGASFEAWTATASLPNAKVVDTSRALDLIEIKGATHSHGGEGEHSHAGTDPHTWSDPLSYLAQGKAVHAAYVAAHPSHTADFDRAYAQLQTDLTALHEAMSTALAHASDVPVAANHPAYNYLARRYKLSLTSFDFDPAEVPGDAALATFTTWSDAAGERPVLWWESAPSADVISAFPEAVQHIVIDPLEQPAPNGYDYLGQATTNAMIHTHTFGPEQDSVEPR